MWLTDNIYFDNGICYSVDDDGKVISARPLRGTVIRKLFNYLINHPNIVIPNENLISAVWNADYGYGDDNLQSLIHRAKKLIGDNNFITNQKGGYMLNSPQKPLPDIGGRIANNPFNKENNVYVATKKEIESYTDEYSLTARCKGASRIRQVCYAATSFLAADNISCIYNADVKDYFNSLIENTGIDIVIADPGLPYMADMVNYKLRPRVSRNDVDRTNPFQKNFIDLIGLVEDIGSGSLKAKDFNVYFAPFSMSNAYFQCIFDDRKDRETIKVDMYVPMFSEYERNRRHDYVIPNDRSADDNRPSFLVKYGSAAYEMFEHNIDDIIRHSTHIILKGEFQGDWEQRINDYADGKFERPFELSDINDNLGIDKGRN
jgi:DNA-binding winged helix-turn-helix (wHTH) protein